MELTLFTIQGVCMRSRFTRHDVYKTEQEQICVHFMGHYVLRCHMHLQEI
uniref:Uncharacterized protein n=1 Tax=Aegilops tauschii subsp. strangulata TaxID=200361 RepID=A0A453M9Q2_AEGTS